MQLSNTILGQALGPIILVIAFVLYTVHYIIFMTDPWSSWIHIETAYFDETIRYTLATNS